MDPILDHIQRIYPLPAPVLQEFAALLTEEVHPKNHVLLREGHVEHKMYFIERGIARAFCYREEKEITFWFGAEGDVVLSYNSYVADKPGYETVELLEDAVVHSISHNDIRRLFDTHIELANWGRKLAEQELIKTESCFIGLQFQPAVERYKNLLESNPALIQRVQLGHIASYLGVSQVTLSRIRAELRF
ncbi:Crp/Fnr family transcriptional regulator [Paraflavitalea sp. CAU 1676]|uniref:Crp/Fnr family transcriptional regulator n=1 Tax=Paraflavitalea sp. CAU 1676 TaxID=3032598 RepID=UPI0023DADE37|nr:Crp/Fnr family transcriptional regulator [Paraflavitalea sp. CAU 1676]MDF2189583.1 Crp/Fnr family transcriptional regulator [Paraflavitalea sp. CAU 1676]